MIKKKEFFIFIVIIVLTLAVLWVMIIMFTKKRDLLLQSREEKTATGVSIPKEVHVYNGRVEETGEGYLVMRSFSASNYLPADSVMRVSFDEKTEFVKKSAPETISSDVLFIKIIEESSAEEDIAPGAFVVVYSSDNIKGDLEFLAERVVIVEF